MRVCCAATAGGFPPQPGRGDLRDAVLTPPAIPNRDGEAAWVVARIAQIRDLYRDRFGIELESALVVPQPALHTKFVDQADQLHLDGIEIELDVPIDLNSDGSAYAEDFFQLMLMRAPLPDGMVVSLPDVPGLAFATPQDADYLETRWTLQIIDRIPEAQAAKFAERL